MKWSDFSRENLEAATSPEIYRRGIEYFRQGHLVKACQIDNQISGIITGTGGDYKVRLWLEDSKLQGECSCPYPGFCKHIIALGIAWLEEKTAFIDLQPQLSTILKNPVTQKNILLDLIHKDPINFLALFPDLVEHHFISSRGIANLIRNIFTLPQMTLINAEALWEKIERVEQLIHRKVQDGDILAVPLLLDLLSGYEKAFTSYPNEKLIQLWKNEIRSLASLLNVCTHPELDRIYEKIWSLYLNPNLWELSSELRELLWNIHPWKSDFLFNCIDECFLTEPPLLVLISLYTLLAEAPFEDSRLPNCLNRITAKLTETTDGSLWLIDKLIEFNLAQAYKLAKSCLHRFMKEQSAFRERLITIHQKRSEFKQAASLSFIQFQENPNFEEYCRLKGLLVNAPDDWGLYCKRISECLRDPSVKMLALQIFIEEGDSQGMHDNLSDILGDEALFTTAVRILGNRIQKNLIDFYPCFIKELLHRQSPSHWKLALELMVLLKRYYLSNNTEKEHWLQFQMELQRIYQGDTRFSRKFATILSESD